MIAAWCFLFGLFSFVMTFVKSFGAGIAVRFRELIQCHNRGRRISWLTWRSNRLQFSVSPKEVSSIVQNALSYLR